MPNTTNLDQANPEEGGSYDTWGDILDANRQIVDKAAGSTATITTASGTVTLTQDQSNHAILKLTASLTGNLTVDTLAGKSRFWSVYNGTSGSFSVTFRVAGGAGASVVAPQGKWSLINTDGTDCRIITLNTLGGNVAAGAVITASIGDAQVTTAKLADSAVMTSKIADEAATTAKIAANAVTYAKLQQIAPNRLLGNPTASPADVVEIKFLDEDDMASNDPNAVASQQSAKAYVDNRLAAKFTISTDTPSGGQDGDIWFRILP